jgi:hypothetical protein
MAFTPTYEHSTTLKTINVNGSIYWVKDADVRALIATFGDAVLKNVDTTFDEDSVNLATSAAIATYVEEAIQDLEGAMHFRGVITRQEGETDAEAIARVVTDPEAGDVVIMQDNGKEYIYGGATAGWEEVGDQNIYLTIAAAAATYVPLTRTVAGIALDHNITVAELEDASALNIKALAHKDSATGSVTTADSIDDITVAKADTYSVASTPVAVPATYSALDVTPAGSVSVTADVAAAVSYDKATSTTVTSVASDAEHPANYTPAGTVGLPSFTSTVTPTTDSVATVTDAGTGYTLSAGSVSQAADTTGAFSKKPIKMAMDTTDTEQLNLTYVNTTDTDASTFYSDAVTASGTVTYTDNTLTGALPTFGTKTVLTAATVSTTADNDATFSGTGAVIGVAVNSTSTAATVTQPTYTASFSGTEKTVTPAVATTVNAAGTDGAVTVGTETKSLTLNTSAKTVTVS